MPTTASWSSGWRRITPLGMATCRPRRTCGRRCTTGWASRKRHGHCGPESCDWRAAMGRFRGTLTLATTAVTLLVVAIASHRVAGWRWLRFGWRSRGALCPRSAGSTPDPPGRRGSVARLKAPPVPRALAGAAGQTIVVEKEKPVVVEKVVTVEKIVEQPVVVEKVVEKMPSRHRPTTGQADVGTKVPPVPQGATAPRGPWRRQLGGQRVSRGRPPSRTPRANR